ncbi:MAG: stage 0 sporulation protein [Endomicrobium sp.]|uniref:PSP1 domain-containing protein n=1 Tax=Candidatus Endomicrobiellum pyrsonymphae TaxID=1408203 RepID=UPI00357F89B4|nr:stage 0 sporulation protein [Endomicrobium sp.]
MPTVVGVMLRKIKDKIYADVRRFDLRLNDEIILVTDHGVEVGVVCERAKNIPKSKDPVGKVLRKAMDEDKKRVADNERKALKAHEIVAQKADDHGLDMKTTYVYYTFDCSKLFVYYTSETRVDFRELIKDLGHILKTKIQMVQIGVRNESKMIGGVGTCGQILCCQGFLKDFNSVTIDMAKEQDLLSNTAKLSGLCGRLMCCISYENDTYKTVKKDLPEIGTIIATPEGKAKLTAIDCIRERVTVDFGDRIFKNFTIKQINDNNHKESDR